MARFSTITHLIMTHLMALAITQAQPTMASEPSCEANIKTQVAKLATTLQLQDSFFKIDPKEACLQQNNTDPVIPFATALDRAYVSLLNDPTHIESPLAIAIELAYDELGTPRTTPTPSHVIAHAKRILSSELRQSGSVMTLLPSHSEQTPDGGETTTAFWIFKLKLPHMSDHIFWALVDRQGAIPAYNYGFN